jgi:hypothetical protein
MSFQLLPTPFIAGTLIPEGASAMLPASPDDGSSRLMTCGVRRTLR